MRVATSSDQLPLLCKAHSGAGWAQRYMQMAQPILILKLVLNDKKPRPEDTWYTGTILERDGTFRTEEFQSVHNKFYALEVIEQ